MDDSIEIFLEDAGLEEPPSKHRRSANFTNAEKSHLFNIICDKYITVIEDKKTNRASITKKKFAWKKIEQDFNATNLNNILRTSENLKKFYENRKKCIRKSTAEHKQQLLQTGGGPPPKTELEEADKLLYSLLNKKTIVVLNNIDSDMGSTQNIEYELDGSSSNSEVFPSHSNWGKYTPSDLQNNISPELSIDNGMDKLHEDRVGLEDKNIIEVPKRKTSKIIRHAQMSRRRPTTTIMALTSSDVSARYDELLNKRLILINKQIKLLDDEAAFKKEQQNLQLELLNIEIAIKKIFIIFYVVIYL
ncbi:hypothetical protein RN001_005701 [Aquatica leii]|uniref:Regulatory protein zeste n=1 Tax=Aquatica leii TaxID=1421715 RepID=A0AAN7Q1M8_9COLE|nr:hypothetical protein RN001_005701 [Aquatica leii]